MRLHFLQTPCTWLSWINDLQLFQCLPIGINLIVSVCQKLDRGKKVNCYASHINFGLILQAIWKLLVSGFTDVLASFRRRVMWLWNSMAWVFGCRKVCGHYAPVLIKYACHYNHGQPYCFSFCHCFPGCLCTSCTHIHLHTWIHNHSVKFVWMLIFVSAFPLTGPASVTSGSSKLGLILGSIFYTKRFLYI